MAKFLNTRATNYYLEELLKNASDQLILISPLLKINDPRQGTHFIKPNRKDGIPIHLAPEIHIQPQENRIIMFPSWLEHCVEMNESDDIRISVSFNFLQDGFQ